MPDVEIQIAQSKCPFCHDVVDVADRAVCATCLAVHHLACWTEHGACSACRGEQVLTLQQRMVTTKLDERIEELASDDMLLRRWAAYTLRKATRRDQPALPALTKTLLDPDRWTRMWSAVAVGQIGIADPKVVERLRRLADVEDEHERVRVAARDALAKLQGKSKS